MSDLLKSWDPFDAWTDLWFWQSRVCLRTDKLSKSGGAQERQRHSVEVCNTREEAGVKVRRTREEAGAEVRSWIGGAGAEVRWTIDSAGVELRRLVTAKVRISAGFLRWSCRSFLKYILAVFYLFLQRSGFKLVSGYWCHFLVTAFWEVICLKEIGWCTCTWCFGSSLKIDETWSLEGKRR